MSAPKDGGPAFPIQPCRVQDGENLRVYEPEPGMTLRDWFAGQERINPDEEFGWELLESLAGPRPGGDWKTKPREWFAWSNRWQAAVKYARADATLAERAKQS